MVPALIPVFAGFPLLNAVAAAPTAGNASLAIGDALGGDFLLIITGVLLLVALASLGGVLSARRETRFVARLARHRAQSMNELLRTVRMAESIAELGVWQYDPLTAEQQWSKGMRLLFGVDHHDEFVAGDAETLLFANDIDLIGSINRHQNERAPYTMHYDIYGYDGQPRSISVQACNLFGDGGALVRVVAVVRDVTDQVSRERALEHSRLVAISEARRARQLAETDPLTGLANRRRVMNELDRMVLEARRLGNPLMLMVFDIDRFKQVNDTHGHIEGDKVLQRVAQIAHNQSRESDLVGRVGGEEFVWIVPNMTKDHAGQMAERLRQAVSHGSRVGHVQGVTISLGLADLGPADTSLTLFARADHALYQAKNGGRDQVSLAA
ncbi:MAG: GGDEF domain-containing protein [Erythrobacter sp.]